MQRRYSRGRMASVQCCLAGMDQELELGAWAHRLLPLIHIRLAHPFDDIRSAAVLVPHQLYLWVVVVGSGQVNYISLTYE